MCAFRQMGRQTCLTLWMVACNRAPRSWGKKKAICPASKEELWRCESRISWVDAAARANTADMPKAEWAPWGKTPLRVFEDNEEHFLQPKSQRTFTCFLFFSWKYLANPILALLQLSRGFHFSREVGMREAIALVLLRQLHIELEIVPTILLQVGKSMDSMDHWRNQVNHWSISVSQIWTRLHMWLSFIKFRLICGKDISKKGSINSTYDPYIAASRYSGTWRAECVNISPCQPQKPRRRKHQLMTRGASIPSTSLL